MFLHLHKSNWKKLIEVANEFEGIIYTNDAGIKELQFKNKNLTH